jgi:hypothetical protein
MIRWGAVSKKLCRSNGLDRERPMAIDFDRNPPIRFDGRVRQAAVIKASRALQFNPILGVVCGFSNRYSKNIGD